MCPSVSIPAIRDTLGLTSGFFIEFVDLGTIHIFLLKSVLEMLVSSTLMILLPCDRSLMKARAYYYLRMRFWSRLPVKGTRLIFLYLMPRFSFRTVLILQGLTSVADSCWTSPWTYRMLNMHPPPAMTFSTTPSMASSASCRPSSMRCSHLKYLGSFRDFQTRSPTTAALTL